MGCAVSTPMEPCEPNTPNVLTRKAEGKVGSAEEVGVLLADLTDQMTLMSMPLSIVIFGATGDLARKKLFPALYQLVLLGHLPRGLRIALLACDDPYAQAHRSCETVRVSLST